MTTGRALPGFILFSYPLLMNNLPKISIIIPVKPGLFPSALESLQQVDYPATQIEIIVAEGKQPSRQRNEGVRKSAGDLLCFLDDDSKVGPKHLELVVKHLAAPSVAAVGGPSLTPSGDSELQQSFGLAFSSPFGGGGVRNRYRQVGVTRETDDRELILCNLSFRREAFTDSGGFDERLYPNEENELLHRLKLSEYKLLHDPDIAVFRSQRHTIRAFIKQLFGYGRGRAEQTLITRSINLPSLVPSLFVAYLMLLPFFNHQVLKIPLWIYIALLLFFTTLGVVRSRRMAAGMCLFWVFPLLHLCYGIGMIWGFIAPRHMRRKSEGDVTIKIVKPVGECWKSIEDTCAN